MLSIAAAPFAAVPLYTNEEGARFSFKVFKVQFNRSYTADEDEKRFSAFVGNLKLADARNAEETKGAVHGVTKFMDLTPQEFSDMLGYRPPAEKFAEEVAIAQLPDGVAVEKDWTGHFTTPVKDQGRCGSCWAFSTTEQIESDAMRELGVSYKLSTQQIISCDQRDGGCNGGNTETAYKYLEKAGGLVLDKDYPDTSHKGGKTGSCSSEKASDPVISVATFKTIKSAGLTTKGTEAAMASYVESTGPLSICVDANKWQTYKGGIMTNCPTHLDHCVQAVGINTKDGYWKVRNSWNTDWGEDGFIRLEYGSNQCGLTNDPTWATVGLVAHEKLVAQQAAALIVAATSQ